MKKHGMKVSLAVILCVQLLFLTVFLFFRETLDPGFTFFRITSYEEWNWILTQAPSQPAITEKVVATVYFLQDVLSLLMVIGFVRYYWKRHLKKWDSIVPIGGILLYYPVFYYIKHIAPHYYLWMRLLPIEVFSLILLTLLLFSTQGRSSSKPNQ